MQNQYAHGFRLTQLHFGIVHAVVNAAEFQIVPDLCRCHPSAVLFAFRCAGAQVRNTYHLIHADHGVAREIRHIAAQFAAGQRFLHSVGVRQFAAAEIQDVRPVLHLRDHLRVNGAAGLVVQRNMEGNEIRLCDHVVRTGRTVNRRAQAPGAFNGNEGIVADDIHAQAAARGVRHNRADGAQADHAQRLAPQFGPHKLALAFLHQLADLVSLALQGLGPFNAAGDIPPAQHQAADHQLRHGIRVGAGSVENNDAFLRAFVQRDVVHAGARPADGQQFLVELHVVHRRAAHQNGIRHRFILVHRIFIRAQLRMNNIRNSVQGLNLVHYRFSFSNFFINSTNF